MSFIYYEMEESPITPRVALGWKAYMDLLAFLTLKTFIPDNNNEIKTYSEENIHE